MLFSPQRRLMLLQILVGVVVGWIWVVNVERAVLLAILSSLLNRALAFLYLIMFSVVMFRLRVCHVFIFSFLNFSKVLFHHGTLLGRVCGEVCGMQ